MKKLSLKILSFLVKSVGFLGGVLVAIFSFILWLFTTGLLSLIAAVVCLHFKEYSLAASSFMTAYFIVIWEQGSRIQKEIKANTLTTHTLLTAITSQTMLIEMSSTALLGVLDNPTQRQVLKQECKSCGFEGKEAFESCPVCSYKVL